MEILNEKIIEIIEKDEINDEENNFLVEQVEKLIDVNDALYEFYQIILRIESYEKTRK